MPAHHHSQSSIHRKEKHGIGSIKDVVLISQPLNAPLLFIYIALSLPDELFNCLLRCLRQEKGTQIFPKCVGCNAIDVRAGHESAGSHFRYLTLNICRHINDAHVYHAVSNKLSQSGHMPAPVVSAVPMQQKCREDIIYSFFHCLS